MSHWNALTQQSPNAPSLTTSLRRRPTVEAKYPSLVPLSFAGVPRSTSDVASNAANIVTPRARGLQRVCHAQPESIRAFEMPRTGSGSHARFWTERLDALGDPSLPTFGAIEATLRTRADVRV